MAKKLDDYYLHDKDDFEPQKLHKPATSNDNRIKTKEKSMSTGRRIWAFFRPVVIFVASLLLVFLLVSYGIDYVKTNYFDPVDIADTSEKQVIIDKGSSLSTISEQLEDEGIIRNKQVFKLYVDFSDNASKLRAGTYTLSPSMDFNDIIYSLRKGASEEPTGKITLLEGLTAEYFAEVLTENELLEDQQDYLEKCETGDGLTITSSELKEILQNNQYAQEKRKYALEGYLFPDTYEFYKDSTAASIINRQLSRFYEMFSSSDYSRVMELEMTVDEVVTLASIIEKEGQEHDFAKVSAVLHNRLKEDWPLQCDSTMAYALGIQNRIVLTYDELERDKEDGESLSPYNTDQRHGLPVGPICNPSKAAINAALYPDEEFMEEDYMFFALTEPEPDSDGKLYLEFNKDADAHQETVDQYKPMWDAFDRQKARDIDDKS